PTNGLPKTPPPLDTTRNLKSTLPSEFVTPLEFIYLNAIKIGNIINSRFAVSHAVLDRDHVRDTQPDNPNLQKYEDRINETRNQLDEQVADLGIPLAKMPTTHDDLKALCDKFITQQSPKSPKKTESKQKRKKADTDSDGFKLPPKHLTRKHPRGAVTPVSTTPISTSIPINPKPNSTNLADDPVLPAPLARRPRIPPFFVVANESWCTTLNILRTEAPSLKSVMTRDNFMKLTVEIQETHLTIDQEPNIPGFKILKDDRLTYNGNYPAGGTCIYVRDTLVHHRIQTPRLEGIEATIINIEFNNYPPVTFISIYKKHHNRDFPTADLAKLLNISNNVIIAGDFNATHKAWNNAKNSKHGTQLYKFISNRRDIQIIAPNTHTHLSQQARASHTILDFALFKNIPFTHSIETLNDLSSDHLPIVIKIDINGTPRSAPQLHTTNWNNFNFYLQNTPLPISKITNTNDADTAVTNFTNTLHDAFNKSSKPRFTQRKPNLPKEIKNQIKIKNHVRRLWQISRDPNTKRHSIN
ncbi:RNA-directed DNA polymerase from mobile element jockey, partial [Caerostris extrusa]